MTVWLVNPFDNLPSEGNRPQRYWLMAEAFVRAGHKVVYWTSDFSHATKKRRVEKSLNAETQRSRDGIEVEQIPTLPYKKNICWARVKSHKKLAKDFERLALEKVFNAEEKCAEESEAFEGEVAKQRRSRAQAPARNGEAGAVGIVIASTPPLGLCAAAMKVARSCGAKFVCDIQDAWPETFERILPRFVWSMLGMRKAAKRLYCEADGVTAVSKRYIELARERGSKAPMRVFGHAIERCSTIQPNDFNAEKRSNGEEALRLVYAGNMSLSYDLETVIKVVQGMTEVTLDVAGNGPDIDRLKALAAGSNNIRFHGYLGESELAALLRSCEVGVIPMFPESCVGVPGKLADYAAARLRVIESLGGECQEIIEKYGAGVHYTAGDINSFKSVITQLRSSRALARGFAVASQPPLRKLRFLRRIFPLRLNNQESFAAEFDARRIMGEYVAWCEEVVK